MERTKKLLSWIALWVLLMSNTLTPRTYAQENIEESEVLQEESIQQAKNNENINQISEDIKDSDVDDKYFDVDDKYFDVDDKYFDVDEELLNSNNNENDQYEEWDDSEIEKENEQQLEISNPANPSTEDDHGVDNKTSENTLVEDNKIQDLDNQKTSEYEQSEVWGLIKNLGNDILELGGDETEKIESEEIYWTWEYEWVKVEVYAQTWAFIKWTILSISPITWDNEISDIQDVIKEQKNVEKTEKLIAFDITFSDPDTKEELQPKTWTVQVTFNYKDNNELKAAIEDECQEVKVYHLNDKDEEWEKVGEIKDVVVEEMVINEEKSIKESEIVLEAKNFSIFIIWNVWIKWVNQWDSKSVTFYASWWVFSNWDSTKSVQYYYTEPMGSTKNSDSWNFFNNWDKYANYSNNQARNRTVKIDGAAKLHITLKYSTEENCDYLYVFKGVYDWDVTKNMSKWQEYTFNWWNSTDTPIVEDFYIDWDTVTFSFYSDSSVRYYWYYAIIEGCSYGIPDDTIENPQRDGYLFLWWYESWTNNLYDRTQYITGDMEFNAKRWTVDEEEKETAKFLNWQEFNSKIKTLANRPVWYGTFDYNIKWFERADSLPENEFFLLVSSIDSEASIFAWYDDESYKIKYYTKAKNVYLNEDSSYMFYSLKNFELLDLEQFKTDFVINMNYMFAFSFTSLEWLLLDFSNLNLENLESVDNMFYDSFYEADLVKNVTINFSKVELLKVTSMKEMFGYFCAYSNASWIKIDFSEADIRNATNINKMFSHLWFSNYESSITWITLDLSKAKLYNVNDIDGMFNGAFRNQISLNWIKIDLSEIDFWSIEDNSNIINMRNRFSYFWEWKQATSTVSWVIIDFSDANLSRVQDVSSMFQLSFQWNKSVSWIKIDFSNADMSNVTNMKEMFYDFIYWYQIETIEWITLDFSRANISNVWNVEKLFDHAFAFSKNATWIKIDFSEVNFWRIEDNNSLINMERIFDDVFYDIETLNWVIIDFSRANMNRVWNMWNMFYDAFYSIKNINWIKIDFSESNMSNVANMAYMFHQIWYWDNSIFSWVIIDLSKSHMNNVRSMNNMFYYAFAYWKNVNDIKFDLTNIDFSNVDENINLDMGSMFYGLCYGYGSEYISWVIVDFSYSDLSRVANMWEMFYYWFAYWNSINNVNINFESTDLRNVKNMQKMFYDFIYWYDSVQNVDWIIINFKNADMRGVENMQEMFEYGFAYGNSINNVNINFESADLRNVKNMQKMFYDFIYWYDSVQNVDWIIINFKNADMRGVENMQEMFEYAFWYIDSEKIHSSKLDFSDTIFSGTIINMGKMFYYFWLDNIDLGNLNTSNVLNMYEMFRNASNLKSLDLSKFDTSKVTNMWEMFYETSDLERIYVSDKFTTNSVWYSWSMFYWSTSIVWWNWTTYDADHIDWEYARIDTPEISWYFTNILDKPYKITYNLDWWSLAWEKTTYTQRDTFTLPTPTKQWYIFRWWIWSNGNNPQVEIRIEAWTVKWNLEYTAVWELDSWSHSSWGWGKRSEPTTSEVTNDTTQEHNSAEDKTTKPSDTTTAPLNEETSKEVISVTQEIAEDGTEVEVVVEAVAIKNTNIVATVRTETPVNWTTSSTYSSSAHTQEQADAYSFAKANWITTTESIETAKMNTELTRIQMAKMLSNFAINVLWEEPDVSKWTVNFDDVNDKMNEQYDNAVTKAYQLWIMWQNVKDNEFRPNDGVTRAEFTTALSRLLYKTDEWEYKWTSKYYIPHIVKLYNEWIVNKAEPKIKEKRWYVMTMLKRTVE